MGGRWKVDTQWATIILVGITLDVRLTTDSKSATKRKVRSRAGSIIYAAGKQTSRPQVITWNALTFQHLQFGLPRGETSPVHKLISTACGIQDDRRAEL